MQDQKTSVLSDDLFVPSSPSPTSKRNDLKDSPSDSFSLFQEIDDAILLLETPSFVESSIGAPPQTGWKDGLEETSVTTDDFSDSSFLANRPKSKRGRTKKKKGTSAQKKQTPIQENQAPFQEKLEGGPVTSGVSEEVPKREKVRRRRQIDPTTCERDYSLDEIEFMNALDNYKRLSGRMFPTCSEILEVVRSLGYVKMPQESAENETAFASMTATPLHGGTPALLDESRGESEEIVTIFWNSENTAPKTPPLPMPDDYPDFDYREPLLIF